MTFLTLIDLALKSLWNRRLTAALTIFTLAVSVCLLLGVEKVRTEAKESFANTISGTDLIVGARSGTIQLLLYSVFRIGNATNNISWGSYETLRNRPEVAWAIPFSLGDSHEGFRVLGTSADYFRHFRFGRKQSLTFNQGRPFEDLFETVIGADVAEKLGYRVGERIVIAHGLGQEGFSKHKDKPFTVSGILRKTGTPVDRTVHVSLEGIEAIHVDWRNGSRMPGLSISADSVRGMELQPKSITAVLVGLRSKFGVFALQRSVNQYQKEPLLAILPGVALHELWGLMGTAEAALSAISGFVVATGILGMTTMLLSSLNERRREMAILRSVGARPNHIFGMLVLEAVLLDGLGVIMGLILLYAILFAARPLIDAHLGLFLTIGAPSPRDIALLVLVVVIGALASILPAYRAYRQSLADGLIVHS